MPQPQTTPTQSQQQPHALIIPETRLELPLEDPLSTADTKYPPPSPTPDHMHSKDTQALKQKMIVRSKSQTEQKSSKAKQPLQQSSKRQAKVDFNNHDVRTPKISKGKPDVKCQRAM
jgi:hypothetical protein